MHVRGDQWPFFLYADLAYDPDDPWNGLLRNQLLVFVSEAALAMLFEPVYFHIGLQARLHLSKLGRRGRAQGNKVGKRAHPQHDVRYHRLLSIYCHPGTTQSSFRYVPLIDISDSFCT
jgi:hypothetical protein